MKMKLLFASIAAFAFTISAADAQVVKRAKNQHQRIKEGVKSGELTKAEAANLRTDQKEIRQEVKEARADGVVTKDERKEVRQDQRQESRKIYRKKHNARERH
jgi:multidrug resistance efflux pump